MFCFPFFRRLFSSWTRSSRTLASLSWAPSSRCVLHYFVDFFSGFSGLAAFFLLPLGGWAPLAAFSLRFPLGSWAGGCCVFGLFFSCCALLHLASSL